MSDVAALKRARAYVEKGWTQGICDYTDRDASEFTLSSAIAVACDYPHGSIFPHYRCIRALSTVVKASPYDWNNVKGRTKDEVLAAFDRAISASEVDDLAA